MNDEPAATVEARPGGLSAGLTTPINALVSPARCWEVLDARPLLSLWNLLWVSLLVTVLGIVNLPLTLRGMEAMMVYSARSQGREMPPEQLEQMRQTMEWGMRIFAWVGTPVFIALNVLFMTLLIWFAAAVLGGSTRFSRSFAVASSAALVHPLLAMAYSTLILQLDPPEIRRPEDMVRMMPSAGADLLFGGADLPVWLSALLMRVDLFNIWWIALVASGTAALLGLRKGQGIAVGVGIWVLTAGVQVLWAAIGLGRVS